MTDRPRGPTQPPDRAGSEPAPVGLPRWQDLEAVLGRYLSPIIVQGVAARFGGNGPRSAPLSPERLAEVLPHLEAALRLFAAPGQLAAALRELEAFWGRGALTESVVAIVQERDVGEARACARLLCEQAGANDFVAQRAVTIVSELARNIFKYASPGRVEFTVADRALRIVALDAGAGIAHLDDILAGRYKSRTGLGKGLTGVRRLADTFEVRTGPTGTRVEVTLNLRG
ncbi:MAG TPA: ATP-binding protein [Polyangiaceae bacterium]|nr:ATP-binding protein [Polyangiaceae bacterium]